MRPKRAGDMKRRPGRPRGSVFSVMVHPRLPKSVYAEIKAVAAAEGLSAATWIRVVCMQALAERVAKRQ
jgi:hypothetical protein